MHHYADDEEKRAPEAYRESNRAQSESARRAETRRGRRARGHRDDGGRDENPTYNQDGKARPLRHPFPGERINLRVDEERGGFPPSPTRQQEDLTPSVSICRAT